MLLCGVQDSALHSLAAARQAVLADLAINPPAPSGAPGLPPSPHQPAPAQGVAWPGSGSGAWRAPSVRAGSGRAGGVPVQDAQASPARLPCIGEAPPVVLNPLAQARAMVSPATTAVFSLGGYCRY